MQKHSDQTKRMLLNTEEGVFSQVVDKEHPFRRLKKIINFEELSNPLRECYSQLGRTGFDLEKGFKALLIQFWEDYSDRQMEKVLKENLAVKWFCGFGLTETTPDHAYFGRFRDRIGVERLNGIFKQINAELEEQGLFGNVFTFIDASTIVTKTALWEERDKAIKDGEDSLNNAVVNKYAADKDARWGAKSKYNIWFGHKRHNAVDMRYGLIKNTMATPANVLDFKVTKDVCPDRGMVFADKLYDCRETDLVIKSKGCYSAAIRKRNNPVKNKDLDRWRSGVRMPFEGTFSKLKKRARYRGTVKVNLQCLAEAICHNLKKAITYSPLLQDALP